MKGVFSPMGIKIDLKADTPSQFDTDALKKQLETMGLTCGQLTLENLESYIQQVNDKIPSGSVQSYGIKAPPEDLNSYSEETVKSGVPSLVTAAKANWTISTSGDGYGPNLEIIQYPAHFNCLYDNRDVNGFAGILDNPPPYTGNFPNAEAIQKLFVNVCTTASATVVKGVDQAAMQAALTNVIQPLANANLSNYNASGSRVMFLVDNYNVTTKKADGLGVLFVNWSLAIRDYKRKSKDGGDTHPVSLTVRAGSVLYDDQKKLCADYNWLLGALRIDPSTVPSCAS
jgi:hypothetical protein